MRDVNILEFGNADGVVLEQFEKKCTALTKQISIAIAILTNSPRLNIKFSVKDSETNESFRRASFKNELHTFSIELSEKDLDSLTLMHLSTPIKENHGTEIQFTNSHNHLFERFGTTIGFLISDRETEFIEQEIESCTKSLHLEITTDQATINAIIKLSKNTIFDLFDKKIIETEGGSSEINSGFFNELKVSMKAITGDVVLPIEEVNNIKVGDFIALNDRRKSAAIHIEGNKVGNAEIITDENGKIGVKVL